MKNLTPKAMRCAPLHCPSVGQLEDGRLLIIGARSGPELAHFVNERLGNGETAIIIDPALLDDVPRGWRTIDALTDDIIWGKPWLIWAPGFEVTQAKRVQLGPRDEYREVWRDSGGEHIEFEPTHFMPLPLPPTEREGA